MSLITRNLFLRLALGIAGLCAAPLAAAQVKWDLPISWPINNFHTQNALAFADAVRSRTDGRVDITVHPGGALGLKGPEVLRAVRDGIVPIAEMYGPQQSGDLPFLATESLPFLVRTPEELRTFYRIAMPHMQRLLARYNQKLLYIVPWPTQMIFTKNPATSVADLKGVKIRTTDRNNADVMQALGMSPVAMPFSDLMPALASGAVNGVQTSAPTAVDTRLWEFVGNALHSNHSWSSNMVTVNLDRFKALPPADQEILEETGRALQAQFWQHSMDADRDAQKTMTEHGIQIVPPAPDVLAQMQAITRPIWDDFMQRVPDARQTIGAYLQERDKP